MRAIMVAVAEELATLLNRKNWSIPALATRGWRPIGDVPETARISVHVPRKTSIPLSRATFSHELTAEVTIEMAHGGASGEDDPVARCDQIAELAQEVEDALAGSRLKPSYFAIDAAEWTAKQVGQITTEYSDDRLDDGVLAIVLEVNYKLER